ncbi:hypothetical protein HHL25_13245 [Rhizobium sp. S-51]|uniref:Uncharacterized protein n=1 Tax=Rhizobium terricola TaxID=2728849 RepID=A0A7Y0FWQ4_9HYPH|nr:hypothetical protein [Rhizobium terricola]NML75091.1 hypothetical protein [Rhizobium terricola]
MLKFFSISRFSGRLFSDATRDWSRDPLSHPAISAMDQRRLADLPLMPERAGENITENRRKPAA